jgi:hypothetical protein
VRKDRLELFLSALHEAVGICGHCGKRTCAGKKNYSVLPLRIHLDDLTNAAKLAQSLPLKREAK